MAVSCMRNASGHNYRNSSFIVEFAIGQIPRSTERTSSFKKRRSFLAIVLLMLGIRFLLLLQLWLALSTDLPNLILRCKVLFIIRCLNFYFRAPVSAVFYTAFVSCRHICCTVIMLCHSLLFCVTNEYLKASQRKLTKLLVTLSQYVLSKCHARIT